MVVAFVLLTSAPGHEEKLAETLKKDEMVTECHVVYGEYDIHLMVGAEDLHALDEFIHSLRTLEGISHTVTLIAVGE
jgi:DNA-binding Lrp family transcriptional regulator